jgi:hypothetical protein
MFHVGAVPRSTLVDVYSRRLRGSRLDGLALSELRRLVDDLSSASDGDLRAIGGDALDGGFGIWLESDADRLVACYAGPEGRGG